MAILGLLETRGIHFQYSKFFNPKSAPTRVHVPSRVGMFLLYAPAFLTGLATFWLFPHGDLGFRFLKSAITIHFFKRILEGLLEPSIDLKYPGIVFPNTNKWSFLPSVPSLQTKSKGLQRLQDPQR
ncbi:Uncharacterized protein TCM_044450 [Theobroma cacao]|uniref:Uncharacterized protein n=1 Tax=Theobroma cacao TaxID=3641 RepID=A0A061FQK8_THECC|nr:Uncharacterized protein TCM_044450 [Theobroma cacao]